MDLYNQLLALYHSNPMFHGAVLGLWAAVAIDLREFFAAKGWTVEGFSFFIAAKRWLTGAVVGAGFNMGVS